MSLIRLLFPGRLVTCFLLGYSLLMALNLFLPLPAQAETAAFTLLHTAGVRGMASKYHYGIHTPYALLHDYARSPASPLTDLRTTGVSVYFYSQGVYLWARQMGVPVFQDFLRQGITRTPLRQEAVQVLQATDSLMLETGVPDSLLPRLQQIARDGLQDKPAVELHTAQLQTYPGPVYVLRLPGAPAQFSHRPEDWEMLLGLRVQATLNGTGVHELTLIGKPVGEGARRMTILQRLRADGQLLVDSGNLVEGLSSISTATLSLQRSNSLAAIRELGYFALNVGAEELQGGLDNLLREQEQYQLPLISATLRQQGKPVFPAYRLARSQGQVLALIGIGDPDELQALQDIGLLSAEIEILAPEQALQQALDEIQRELGRQPEAVAVLTTLQGEALKRLVQRAQGVDVILGDLSATLQTRRETLELIRDRQQQPFVARNHAYAVGILQLELQAERLLLQNEILPVTFEIEPDTRFLQPIMRIRQQAYHDALDTLMPDLGNAMLERTDLRQRFLKSARTMQARQRLEGLHPMSDEDFLRLYPPRLTEELWGILVSNLLLEGFQAEVVFLERPADGIYVPGAWPRLLVYELLKQDDTLEIYYLSGEQLTRLFNLKRPDWISGGLSTDGSRVWNRALQSGQYYRTLLASSIARRPEVYALIKGARKREELVNPYGSDQQMQTVYLRNVLLDFFEQARRQGQLEAELLDCLSPHWEQKQGLLSLKLSDLQLNFSGYNVVNNQSYNAVRETRVTSPNSLNYGGRSKLSLIFDNEALSFAQAVSARYEGLSLLDEVTKQNKFTESQDDFLFSSELQFYMLKFPVFGREIQLIPYLEAVYDTEFTPTVKPGTEELNPRQAELSGVAGLTIPAGPLLKAFKTGLAVRRDFNVPNNLELGVNFQLDHDYPLGSALRWSNMLDLKYYWPTPNDNASSLGLITQWVSALKFSLTDNLALRFFADTYLFQGKLPATSQPGFSLILGVGLAYDRLWKPVYEPLL